jgi:flavin-dependent dehydrogenase
MKIGVIGARVAGSYASLLLSRLGHEVLLFDDSIDKEKPCGGGVTFKALRKISWLGAHPLPHTEIANIRFTTPEGYASAISLPHPIHLFSRVNLDSCLRQWAVESGVRFLPERALSFARDSRTWAIETPTGVFEVDYLIGADGANSGVRRSLIGNYDPSDLSLALGFHLPGLYDPETLRIAFQESGFHGYLWSFPHVDHSSVGIVRWLPGIKASDLRRRVEEFIAAHYPDAYAGKKFYAARIPCLSRKTLTCQRVCGKHWALLGDAAGFADSITAEGIYYALRSAELLAESFRREKPQTYEMEWRSDFGTELESAAAWRDRFYGSMILCHSFIRRALQSVRYSRMAQELVDELIAGSISYNTMFRNLVLRSPQLVAQVFCSKFRQIAHANNCGYPSPPRLGTGPS